MPTDYNEKMAETEMYPFVELFRFTTGSTVYRYSNIEKQIIFQGDEASPQIYQIGLIQRSNFQVDKEFNSISITITANVSSPLKQWIGKNPLNSISVYIFRYFIDTSPEQYNLIFKGKIKKVSIKDNIITANAESQTGIFRKKLPNILYQSYCNNTLYDSVCTIEEDDYLLNTDCTIDGSDLISTDISSYDDDYFTGGYAEYEGQKRLITNNTGNTITLQVPFSDVEDETINVNFYAGCDKNPDTCKNKFSNFSNFVGFPYIPSKNPCIYGVR